MTPRHSDYAGSNSNTSPNAAALSYGMQQPGSGGSRPGSSVSSSRKAFGGDLGTHSGSPTAPLNLMAVAAGVLAGSSAGVGVGGGSGTPGSSRVQTPQTNSARNHYSGNTSSLTSTTIVQPLKLMERSPSLERHPASVALSRGPTPIEDLLQTPRSYRADFNPATPTVASPAAATAGAGGAGGSPGILSPSHVDTATMRPSASRQSGIAEMHKPLLFQAVAAKDSSGFSTRSGAFEWQGMGVYDDEDLDQVS
jgi:hypothetical protein